MKKSSALISMSTSSVGGLDCNMLARLCNKEDAEVLYSADGYDTEFKFIDGSAITFSRATITEWWGSRKVFEETKEEYLYNYNLPSEE